ncbi:hypothetical protein EST38_g2033 [Candolleomyces aberdarensis]|uniref:Uncharacterized protein n=1 Tax=Candolleomyces aberdarensis TaxID=2316362 RepID=A0A4Q2DXX4_9AGAR|nr:hypothetical protein EST38_g2033 [Candolleomyces aberdarensis]
MPPPTPSRPTSPERTAKEGAPSDNLTRYEHRAMKNAIYDQIMEKIARIPQQWIGSGAVAHGRDYESHYVTAKTNNGWDKLSFSNKSGEEFRTCIFGEMGSTNSGTAMGARGNFYIGRAGDTRLEDKPVKGIVAGDPRGNDSSIQAAGVPIYKNLGRASSGRSVAPATPTAKRTVISTASIALLRKGEDSTPTATDDNIGTTTGNRANYVEGSVVTEETTYNVTCLSDYGGSIFQHRNSVVVQPRIIDTDNETLVQPWEIPAKLKPGTLVLMEGTFSVWFIPGGNPVYQFTASVIKILDESDEEPQLPTKYNEAQVKTPKEMVTPKRLSAFDDFGSPSKKAKKSSGAGSNNKEAGAKNKGKGKTKV